MKRLFEFEVVIVLLGVVLFAGFVLGAVLLLEWLYKEEPKDGKLLKGYNKFYGKAHPMFSVLPYILIEKVAVIDAIWLDFGWFTFRRRVLLYRKHKE